MKSCILLWFVGLVALSTALPSFDLKFQSQKEKEKEKGIEKDLEILLELQNRPHKQPVYHFWKWGIPQVRLMKFKWSDCGNSSSKLIFKDINVSPDPIILPGNIKVSASIEFKEDIKGPVTADVTLEKIIDSFHLKIPCIGDYGSCHYDDLCTLLSQITECPKIMNENNIPCHCPFKKGSYSLPPSVFQINQSTIPGGYYTLKVVLSQRKTFVGCFSAGIGFST